MNRVNLCKFINWENMISQRILKEFIEYCPDTGNFVWIKKSCRKVVTGKVAGTVERAGYLSIGLFGNKLKAHRLAFLYMTGNFPVELVDHVDGNKLNNSWANLRECSYIQNGQNQYRAHKHNLSGYLGVEKTRTGRFVSSIVVDKKNIHLGMFDEASEAHNAYLNAKKELHPFGNLNS